MVFNVDVARGNVGLAHEPHLGVEVAGPTVKVLDCLHVLVQPGRPENHAALLPEHQFEHVLGIQFGTDDGDVADPVLPPFVDMDRDDHPARVGVVVENAIRRDFGIQIALATIEIEQLGQVVLEQVVLEPSAASQPGKHPPALGFHLLAEALGDYMAVARKADVRDPHLRALSDLEDHDAIARAAVPLDIESDLDLVVAGLLIEQMQLLGVGLDGVFVERAIGFRADLPLQPAGLDHLVSLEPNRLHAELGSDLEHQVDGVVRQFLALGFDEFEKAGAIKRPDVPVDHRLVIIGARPHLNVGSHDLLADIRNADELDRYCANLLRRNDFRSRRFRLGLSHRSPDQPSQGAGKETQNAGP